jgi:hypothetical protein
MSIAAQIVNLRWTWERTGSLLSSHDLPSSRVADATPRSVWAHVEQGPRRRSWPPSHPHRRGLAAARAIPRGPRSGWRRPAVGGDPPPGCVHPRCPIARPRCRGRPALQSDERPRVACFYPGEMQ